MKRSFLPAFLLILIVFSTHTFAQVGIGTTTPSSHAVLELRSPGNNQGFLVPRVTTSQRTAAAFVSALSNTEAGLLVFDTDDDKFYYWSGTAWIVIEDSVGTGTVTNILTGAGLTGGPISVTGTISLADNGVTTVKIADGNVTSAKIADGSVTAAKILDGTIVTVDLANNSVTDPKIASGVAVNKLTPGTNGQVLTTTAGTAAWGTLDLSLTTNTLSLSGDATTVNLATYLDNTDNQDLTLAGNTLSLTNDGTTINLAPYLDNTDAQVLTFTSPNLSISGGNSVNLSAINTDAQTLSFTSPTLSIIGGNSVNLSAINTDSQDLTLAGNTLSLTGDATTVSLAAYLDNTDAQNLTLGTRTGTQQPVNISGGTGVTIDVADNDNSTTNEIQDLSLAGSTLSLTNDATTVSLAAFLDNTDNQDLTLAGSTLSLTNDGTSVNLAAFLDNTDAQSLTLGTRTGTQQPVNISGGTGVTIDVADNDNSTTNEIQDLSLTGNTLSITGDATTVSLTTYLDNTDNQDLSLAGNTLSLTNDASAVSLAAYLDNTDAQSLTFTPATSTLAISGGNSVTVSATGTAAGDLNGTFPNPTVDGLQGFGVSAVAPSIGQVLKYNGTAWAPGTDNSATPGLNAVLTTGNNAGGQTAINFSSISINRTDVPGALNVNGSQFVGVTALTAVTTYAVQANDYLIVGTATGSVQTTVTLPDASLNIGRILVFRGRSIGAATAAGIRVQAASGDSIDGSAATGYLTPMNGSISSITIVAINANEWIVISKSVFGSL